MNFGARCFLDVNAYQYHLKDHLGNTRLTFSTTPESYTYTATMETELATSEEALFQNVAETRVAMALANSTSQDLVPGANKAARIESTDPIGPLAMLQVNKGDTVKLSAYAYYEGDGSTDGLISESALLAALLSGYSGASGISEVSAQTQAALESGLDFPNNLLPKTNETNDDAPKAFVNYMYFDVDMNFITSGFKQISTAAQFQKELVQMDPLVMEWDGYVMAYVSNESDELNYVHFDDFTIYQVKTHVVYASNYTPFGMQFGEFERMASEPVRYKFQEQEHDTSTGWIAFKWRNYNRRYRRFFNIDPLAEKYLYNSTYAFSENNVTAHRELEGLEKWSIKSTSEGEATKREKIQVDKTDVYTDVKKEQQAEYSFDVDMNGKISNSNGVGIASAKVTSTCTDDNGNVHTTIQILGTVGTGENASAFGLQITTETLPENNFKTGTTRDEMTSSENMISGNLSVQAAFLPGESTNSGSVQMSGQMQGGDVMQAVSYDKKNDSNTETKTKQNSSHFYWSGNIIKPVDKSSGRTLINFIK